MMLFLIGTGNSSIDRVLFSLLLAELTFYEYLNTLLEFIVRKRQGLRVLTILLHQCHFAFRIGFNAIF